MGIQALYLEMRGELGCPFHLWQELWGSSLVSIGETSLLLWCERRSWDSLESKQRNRLSSLGIEFWEHEALLEFAARKLRGSSQVVTGVSGNILSCIRGQASFRVETWDCSRSIAGNKGLIITH